MVTQNKTVQLCNRQHKETKQLTRYRKELLWNNLRHWKMIHSWIQTHMYNNVYVLTRGIQREHCPGSNVWLLFSLVVRERKCVTVFVSVMAILVVTDADPCLQVCVVWFERRERCDDGNCWSGICGVGLTVTWVAKTRRRCVYIVHKS
jgi:hypothetical protein